MKKNNVKGVYTATNASWMNRIECHFTPLKKFAISNSNYASFKEMGTGIRKYICWRNKNPKNKKILKVQKTTLTA